MSFIRRTILKCFLSVYSLPFHPPPQRYCDRSRFPNFILKLLPVYRSTIDFYLLIFAPATLPTLYISSNRLIFLVDSVNPQHVKLSFERDL